MNTPTTCQFRSTQTPLFSAIEKQPTENPPQNRFINARSLSDSELLAVILYANPTDFAIKSAGNLIKKYGGISEISGLSMQQLLLEPGVKKPGALQLLTSVELASRRANEKMLRRPMNSAEAIYQAMAPRLAHKKIEYVFLILLDAKLQATQTIEISCGNVNTALCEPRDVLHEVLIYKAPAFVMIHNHPSGDPSPSKQDVKLTKLIQQSCEAMRIRFVDHMIIGRPSESQISGFYSFTASGILY